MLGTNGLKEFEKNLLPGFIDLWRQLQKRPIRAKDELHCIFLMKISLILSKQQRIKTCFNDLKEPLSIGRDKSKTWFKTKNPNKAMKTTPLLMK